MFEYLRHLHHKIKLVGYTRFYKAAHARVAQRFVISRKIPAQLVEKSGLKSLPFLHQIDLDEKELLIVANRYAENTFSVLGSQLQTYRTIPWHTDVRLQQRNPNADCTFDARSYKNSPVPSSSDTVIKKDIKVPWELARFQYAPLLAIAYQRTGKEKYITALKNQIISWITANPFMQGIHWMNPMEVAIRAVNWIAAVHHAGEALREDTSFYERLVSSLWEHLRCIEHRWEWYDGRTNNHYLSNLVGYAYLCWFFQEMPGMKKRWQDCLHELHSEFAWQVFEEGTSYEGSTRYHAFVTELFVHGFLIAYSFGEIVEEAMIDKLARMLTFADRTKDIIIGDDDSGSLLYVGLYNLKALFSFFKVPTHHKKRELFYYPSFGLSIVKTDQWEISLRHHAYHERQPSAHFHEDIGSITLAYRETPIIVDPGTYVYSASAYWRNYFRSSARHNSFYPVSWPSLSGDDLFFLALKPRTFDKNEHPASMTHTIFGYPLRRSLSWTESEAIISDDISQATESLRWQFIFSSAIELEPNGTDKWDIVIDKKPLLYLESPDIVFELKESWVSPSYGIKQKTLALVGVLKKNIPVATIRFIT